MNVDDAIDTAIMSVCKDKNISITFLIILIGEAVIFSGVQPGWAALKEIGGLARTINDNVPKDQLELYDLVRPRLIALRDARPLR